MLNLKLNQIKAGASAALIIGATVTPVIITTGIVDSPIPIAGIETTAQAQSASVNLDFSGLLNKIVNMARNFWSNYYGAKYLQTYFAHFEPSQVERIKRQYGSSANSFFHNQCKEGFYRASNAQWWQKALINPFAWFYFVHREEGGRVNCYVRYPQ